MAMTRRKLVNRIMKEFKATNSLGADKPLEEEAAHGLEAKGDVLTVFYGGFYPERAAATIRALPGVASCEWRDYGKRTDPLFTITMSI